MSETVRVARVAIKTEVIPRSSGSVGTVYKVTVGRLNVREKAALIDALSKVSASSCEEVERPKWASGTGISFEMYSTLKEIAKPTWICNDAVLEFRTGEFCQHRLDLVRLDDFSEDSPLTPWFKTDEEDEEPEELEHVIEEFTDVGIEVLDLEFAGGNPNCNYWAKIRLFDLAPSEVEKVKRVYERDPEDLPTNTRCGERLEPGFELEVRPGKEHPSLKEVTVVLYCKNYAPLKEVGAYSRDIDITLDYCEGATCPVIEVSRVHREIKVLEPEQRFGYASKTGEFPRLTLERVLVTFHRDRPQYCHIGRMLNSERDSVIRTFDTDYAYSIAGKYPSLTCGIAYAEDILLRTERCCGIMPGVVYLMNRITFVRRWGHILIDDFEVADTDACRALNPVYYDMWRGPVPQATEDTRSDADERADRGAIPEIEKIEFNEPATIIFWKDGTKSVVQARDGEPYDAEKGIAMAIAKKALGNERSYYNTFIHWIKRHKKKGGKR